MQLISGANNKDLEALEDKDEKKEPGAKKTNEQTKIA